MKPLDINLCVFSSHLDFNVGIRVESFRVVPGKDFLLLFGTPAVAGGSLREFRRFFTDIRMEFTAAISPVKRR